VVVGHPALVTIGAVVVGLGVFIYAMTRVD
jgi:hypothetical protein